jgi:hypothetical protein
VSAFAIDGNARGALARTSRQKPGFAGSAALPVADLRIAGDRRNAGYYKEART